MNRVVLALALVLAASSAAAAPPKEKKKGGGETYLQLPTLTATIFRSDGSRGVLQVDVGLDVQNGSLRQKASASIPILEDAFTRVLLTYAPSIPGGAPPNIDIIGSQLQKATDQTLGREGATLLLGTVLEN